MVFFSSSLQLVSWRFSIILDTETLGDLLRGLEKLNKKSESYVHRTHLKPPETDITLSVHLLVKALASAIFETHSLNNNFGSALEIIHFRKKYCGSKLNTQKSLTTFV